MKKLSLIVIAIFFVLLPGCQKDLDNASFVEKYENENFDEFKNVCIHFRSGNRDGSGEIFFASEGIADNGIYVIDVNRQRKTINSCSTKLLKDPSKSNLKKLEVLTLKFIDYPMPSIFVDDNSNVFISLIPNTPANLVRFSDMKYKTKKYAAWKNLKGNWFEDGN